MPALYGSSYNGARLSRMAGTPRLRLEVNFKWESFWNQ